jgi:hypothetical protein
LVGLNPCYHWLNWLCGSKCLGVSKVFGALLGVFNPWGYSIATSFKMAQCAPMGLYLPIMAINLLLLSGAMAYRGMLHQVRLMGLFGTDVQLLVSLAYCAQVLGYPPNEKESTYINGYKRGKWDKARLDRLTASGCLILEGRPRRFIITPKGQALISEALQRANDRLLLLQNRASLDY